MCCLSVNNMVKLFKEKGASARVREVISTLCPGNVKCLIYSLYPVYPRYNVPIFYCDSPFPPVIT